MRWKPHVRFGGAGRGNGPARKAGTAPRSDSDHTHATILLKARVPVKVVSERLGHSSPAFTMTVYQHVLPGMQADAAAMFGDVVFGD